jgi:hypothetical protein
MPPFTYATFIQRREEQKCGYYRNARPTLLESPSKLIGHFHVATRPRKWPLVTTILKPGGEKCDKIIHVAPLTVTSNASNTVLALALITVIRSRSAINFQMI